MFGEQVSELLFRLLPAFRFTSPDETCETSKHKIKQLKSVLKSGSCSLQSGLGGTV